MLAATAATAQIATSRYLPGTVAYDAETGKYLCDVVEDGQVVMLLKGGRGGLGNFQFRTSTNQAPRYAQPGEPCKK